MKEPVNAKTGKETSFLDYNTREKIADEIMEAQKEIWTEALSEMGVELK